MNLKYQKHHGVLVRNPFRTGRLYPPEFYDYPKNSEYLIQRRNKLRKKFYKLKKTLNLFNICSLMIVVFLFGFSAIILLMSFLLSIDPVFQLFSIPAGAGLFAIMLYAYEELIEKYPIDEDCLYQKYRR